MKKFFYAMMALVTLTVFSCKEPEPEPIIEPDDENVWDVLYTADVDYYFDFGYTGITLNYADFVNDGKHIWDEFDLSQAEFIEALGTEDVNSGSTAQVDNSIYFGAVDGSTGYLNETTSTTNGWGHWFTAQGNVCSWGDDAYLFTEGYFVSSENLEFTLGNFPGRIAAGEKYTIIETFYDDDITVAIKLNVNVTDALPELTLNKVGEGTANMELGFDTNYTTYEITGIDRDAIAKAIGCDASQATFYGCDATGKANSLYKGTDLWFSENGVCSWGDGCTIHFGYDADNDMFTTCLYPDEALIGKQFSMIIAFANGSNAYYQTVNIKVAEQDTWVANATIQVGGDCVDTDLDPAVLATYLGYDDAMALAAAVVAGEVTVVPLNADGTEATCTQAADNNGTDYFCYGAFYSVDGNVVNWASGSDAVYFDFYGSTTDGYIGFDITPFDNLTEEHLGTLSFKVALKGAEKTAYVLYNVTVESAIAWATASYADGTVNIQMIPNNSYKGLIITIPAEVAAALGVEDLAAAINDGTVTVKGVNADGSVSEENTGETPFGHWFNAAGDVCSWGAENCCMCYNIKADNGAYISTCQFPDFCTVGSSYTFKQKFIGNDKEFVLTYQVSIVEAI